MPQKPGNHGRIIPLNKKLLHRLYWTENRSLVEVAAIFDVNHRSLGRVFHLLGIRVRPRRTKGQSRWTRCIECGKPVAKIKHSNNGSLYGKRCKEHRRAHYARLAREEGLRPEGKERVKKQNRRSYYNGPLQPNGESQWLSRSKVLLRNTRRLLLKPNSPAACESRNAVSKLVRTLRT